MSIAKIGRRGQLVLPKEIRRALSVGEGDRVLFVRRDDTVTLEPLTQTLLDLRGSVRVEGEQDFEAVRRQVKETRARRSALDAG